MVEFVAGNALRRLNELAIHSTKINAAVCYWTMSCKEFNHDFLSALKNKDSCLVVDIHSPTSIDSLAEFNHEGANIFLYLFQIVGKTETPDSKGIPDHLMHAKVFVFDYGTNEIKIWVGSHNGTRRALLGLNFEFASVVSCERNSEIHLKALQFIGQIKKISTVFKQSEIDLYRYIQRVAAADAFIELTDSQATPLKRSSIISIFGKKDSDYYQLQKVGKKVFLSITNSISGDEVIYKTSVHQSGYLDKQSKSSKQKKSPLTFDKRRYAVKIDTTIPLLEPEQTVSAKIYSDCRYFVTLKVDEALVGYDAFEAPTEHLWEDVDKQLYLKGAVQPISDKALVVSEDHEIGLYRIQGVNLGQANLIFKSEPLSDMQRSLKVLSLTERNSLPEQPLIRKRMLVKRSENDVHSHVIEDY
jgi:hypothetical protein